MPAALGAVAVEQAHSNVVMPVSEDSCRDLDCIAEYPLGRISSGIHSRLNPLDDDPSATFGRLHTHIASGTDSVMHIRSN
jgi:hypothetical protein